MNIYQKMIRFLLDENYRFNISSYYGLLNLMSDRRYIEKQYYLKTHRKLNLENPITFNDYG